MQSIPMASVDLKIEDCSVYFRKRKAAIFGGSFFFILSERVWEDDVMSSGTRNKCVCLRYGTADLVFLHLFLYT